LIERIVAADFGAGARRERDALEAMIAADPRLQSEHDDISLIWDMLGDLPSPDVAARQAEVVPLRRRLYDRIAPAATRVAIVAAAASVVLGVGFGLVETPSGAAKAFTIETGRAERRMAELPDGSSIELAGETRIVVRFLGDRRVMRIERGEALVRIARMAEPFVIQAGDGEIRGSGGLNVKLTHDIIEVTTVAGKANVVVGGDDGGSVQSASLTNGQQLTFGTRTGAAPGSTITAPRDVSVDGTLDWTRGRLEFHGEPLRDVIDEVNRNAIGRVVLLDPSEAGTPIYGVLQLGDLRGLASILADRQAGRGRTAPIVRIDGAVD
jgi:transmembrane sensor